MAYASSRSFPTTWPTNCARRSATCWCATRCCSASIATARHTAKPWSQCRGTGAAVADRHRHAVPGAGGQPGDPGPVRLRRPARAGGQGHRPVRDGRRGQGRRTAPVRQRLRPRRQPDDPARHFQPGVQRRAPYPARRAHRRANRGARGAHRGEGQQRRPGHPTGVPAAPVRALLPPRRTPDWSPGRHRPGTGHRAIDHGLPRRPRRSGKRTAAEDPPAPAVPSTGAA